MKSWLGNRIHLLFWFFFVLLFLGGATLRFHGIDWGDFSQKNRVLSFHPDEPKFLLMAQEFLKDDFAFDLNVERTQDYVKAVSLQIALLARAIHAIWETFSVSQLYLIGRYLSCFYGIATLLLLFAITFLILKNRWKALFAMGFLAFSSLHIEHSHYATADTASLFWVYLSFLFALLERQDHSSWKMGGIALCAGLALGTKFSFLPLIPLLYLGYLNRLKPSKGLLYLGVTFVSFFLANGLDYSWDDLKLTFNMFLTDNVHAREHNKWLNPLIYIFQLIPALGLPVFLLAVYGLYHERKSILFAQKANKTNWHIIFIFLIPLFIYFVGICYLDVPFTRHALIIVPILCIVAAAGLSRFFHLLIAHRKILALSLIGFLLTAYQAAYCYSVTRYFDKDPRFKAMRWIKKNVPKGAVIGLSTYAYAPRGYHRLENLHNHFDEAEYLVLHESYYYRYLRSELNPLNPAQNIDAVYRGSESNMKNLNLLFAGKLPFEKVKTFEIKTYTPELYLYKKIFGTFPHFLGDVLIYKRISAP